jgi:hypothetical protein
MSAGIVRRRKVFHEGGNAQSQGLMVILATMAIIVGLAPANSQTADEFFKGKTITFYVGLSPGGGYDLSARLVAKYLGGYVPGNPTIIVRNMPGGSGLVMDKLCCGRCGERRPEYRRAAARQSIRAIVR